MKIALGADHRGFPLKEALKARLRQQGYTVVDVGTHSAETSVDYPDFARKVAERVRTGEATYGVLICHTGIGMSMAANKIPGIRAALVWDAEQARLSRAHNDANVLCFPGSFVPVERAWEALQRFLETPFEGGRHARRVHKLEATHD